MKITLGNHKYGLKKTTGGERYITRELTHKGFNKFMKGEIKNKSGIVEIPNFSSVSKALINKKR